jgi:MarR family transcriptional regulator, temperature-dependent positive regulator of motility
VARTAPRSSDTTEPVDALTQLHFAPGHLFRRARQFHDALWLELIGSELTPLQFAALTALSAEPGLNQRELGERIALDKSTLGDIVSRLVRRGYVKRQPDPRDGRSRAITVTAAGSRALNRARPAVAQIGRTMLSCLDAEERCQLTDLLAKVVFSDLALETTNNAPPKATRAEGRQLDNP